MKLTKYTFKTPLFGSIACEGLIPDTDGRIDLSPEQMCRLYDQGEELLMFLTENIEDLAPYVPEELKNVVLRAIFGEFAMIGGRMYLRTYIYTEEPLTETGIDQVQEWITGQMSDGWGEGLEQHEWWTRTIKKPTMYFDEYSLEFEEDEEIYEVGYYAEPWRIGEFNIDLEEVEEVEEDISFEIVATMSLPFHQRQVIKIRGDFALRMFLKDFNQENLAKTIQDSSPFENPTYYLVRDIDGNSGIEVLPRWVCENKGVSTFYDMTVEEDMKVNQMPIVKALLELLK